MIRLRRYLLRLLGTCSLLVVLLCGTAAWYGSGRLVSPPRRPLQDYHRKILDEPTRFGLEIRPFTGPAGTPCLLVEPAPRPGEAGKSRIVRGLLEKRGLSLPPWGASIGTIMLLYGHGGRKEDHLPVCERFCAAGFRCVLMDIPGHGDHPGTSGSFGLKETPLTAGVLAEAAGRFGFDPGPSCLFGVSQGGAIALQAAAGAPRAWRAVASVATFSSLDRPVLRSAEELLPAPLHFCSPLAAASVACGTRLRAGFWPSQVRPVDAAAHLDMPTFIAHGDLDPYIGIDQAREIHAAIPAARKRFRVVRGADHHRVLSTGSHLLYADLCQFFLEAVQTPTADFQPGE